MYGVVALLLFRWRGWVMATTVTTIIVGLLRHQNQEIDETRKVNVFNKIQMSYEFAHVLDTIIIYSLEKARLSKISHATLNISCM